MFKELLNPSTTPLSEDPGVDQGMAIYEYDTDQHDATPADEGANEVDLREMSVAYFVQSFAADTAAEVNAGRWEYVSIMREVDPGQIGAQMRHVRVQIAVKQDNQMSFRLGEGRLAPMAPMRMNLESRTFREAMWPYLALEDE